MCVFMQGFCSDQDADPNSILVLVSTIVGRSQPTFFDGAIFYPHWNAV